MRYDQNLYAFSRLCVCGCKQKARKRNAYGHPDHRAPKKNGGGRLRGVAKSGAREETAEMASPLAEAQEAHHGGVPPLSPGGAGGVPPGGDTVGVPPEAATERVPEPPHLTSLAILHERRLALLRHYFPQWRSLRCASSREKTKLILRELRTLLEADLEYVEDPLSEDEAKRTPRETPIFQP